MERATRLAGVEHLRRFSVSLLRVRMQQVASVDCEGEAALAVAKLHGRDEPLIVEVVEGIARKIQVMFRHDTKRADGGKGPAVFAVKLIDSVSVNDQFPLVTPRQVEVVHQAVARIVFIPVARVVNAWRIVAAIPHVVLARINPSSIGHGSLRCFLLLGCP
jgi:hypothetical protein